MDPVFAVLNSARRQDGEVVILKSKAIAQYLKDGMSDEEAEEMWSYNAEGAKGAFQYSTVDDTMEDDQILDLIEEGEILDPPKMDIGVLERREAEKEAFRILKDVMRMELEDLPLYMKDKSDLVKGIALARLAGEF